jgi:hypothetical protein
MGLRDSVYVSFNCVVLPRLYVRNCSRVFSFCPFFSMCNTPIVWSIVCKSVLYQVCAVQIQNFLVC